MIPVCDNTRLRTRPLITSLLIAANLGVFVLQLIDNASLIEVYSLVPARLWQRPPSWSGTGIRLWLQPLFACMFLHGGFLHLLGNLWSLWIFGPTIEDRLGHGRYLVFYLTCGVMAGLLHALIHPASTIPTIGASGAIAGVLGAYFLLFPWSWITFMVPIFFLPLMIKLPAVVYLFFWLLSQLLGGYSSLAASAGTPAGIAFWAHIGGFGAGMLLVRGQRRGARTRAFKG